MLRGVTTVIAFAGKEIREVIRQPRLIAVLIAGPFVILGLFAVGYRPEPPPLKTVLVASEAGQLAQRVDEMQESLPSAVEILDVTEDEEAARELLADGEIDVVVITPPDAFAIVQGNEQAPLTILHNQLDPFDRAYIDIFARASTDELNRSVLAEVAGQAQNRTAEYQDALPIAQQAAAELTAALEASDPVVASQAQTEIERQLLIVEEGLGGSGDFLDGVSLSLGADSESSPADVAAARESALAIDVNAPDALNRAQELEATLAEVEEVVSTFGRISPEVLVQPFVAESETLVDEVPLTTYYTPAVAIVLLQHVVLTFAALSVVRERSLGITELFRVGPIGVRHVLTGKFLGYALIGSIVAAILATGIVYGFGTPMNGSWIWLTVVLALTMTASLGLGFLIAALAQTDAQAVQFAMLALLFTIFFSGLVVSLTRLAPGVKQVAFAVPATAGTTALQDVMFRGTAPGVLWVGILGGYTVLTFFIASRRLRRAQIA